MILQFNLLGMLYRFHRPTAPIANAQVLLLL